MEQVAPLLPSCWMYSRMRFFLKGSVGDSSIKLLVDGKMQPLGRLVYLHWSIERLHVKQRLVEEKTMTSCGTFEEYPYLVNYFALSCGYAAVIAAYV